MQPTPLRGPEIVAFLKAGIGPIVLPIYTAARLMGNPLGARLLSTTFSGKVTMPARTKPSHVDHMVRNIQQATADFPHEDRPGCGYWHLHLPTSSSIDAEKTPFSIRKTCVQTLIDRAHYLRSVKPMTRFPTRVVACISLPKLFDAQLIVFFGSPYYDTFFDRDSPLQQWTRLPQERSLVREWNVDIPSGFIEIGYQERIRDTHYRHDGELWFIGELEERSAQ